MLLLVGGVTELLCHSCHILIYPCMFVPLCTFLFTNLSLSVYLSVSLSICVSVYIMSAYLLTYLFIYLFVRLPMCVLSGNAADHVQKKVK